MYRSDGPIRTGDGIIGAYVKVFFPRTYFDIPVGAQNRCGAGLIDIKRRLDKTDIFPDGALVVSMMGWSERLRYGWSWSNRQEG
jgi:hypothetical protein